MLMQTRALCSVFLLGLDCLARSESVLSVFPGTFASTLPTYQRSEVMLFIMSKVPLPSLHHALDTGKAG